MKTTIILILFLSFAFFSCQKGRREYIYPENPLLGTINGLPCDSNYAVLPFKIKHQGCVKQLFLDSSQLTEFNMRLHVALAPMLYNYYLNQEIYRFIIFCSIRGTTIVTINHNRSGYFLNLKVADNYLYWYESGNGEERFRKYVVNPDSIPYAKRFLKDVTVNISKNDWSNFKDVLQKIGFYRLTYRDTHTLKIDGSDYVLEAHTKDNYWLLHRESPDNDIKIIYNAIKEMCNKFQLKIDD